MKTEFLNVSPVILDTLGAVSYETAEAMVNGLKIRSGADMCISVTGFAGPTSDTIDTPVGTVYVGVFEMVISIQENIKDYTNRRIFE